MPMDTSEEALSIFLNLYYYYKSIFIKHGHEHSKTENRTTYSLDCSVLATDEKNSWEPFLIERDQKSWHTLG